MKKRSFILRICPECKKEELVRKDGSGKFCRSCRAKLNSRNRIGRYVDIINHKFGNLLVVGISHQANNKVYYWNCTCKCGNSVTVSGSRLRTGKTRSCGCIVKSQNGLSTTGTYRSWRSMIQRCYDKSVWHYKNYGGRGISVCDRWRNSFLNFLNDMGLRPKNKTLDRIDNSRNYELDNCKWSTPSEQARNRRS